MSGRVYPSFKYNKFLQSLLAVALIYKSQAPMVSLMCIQAPLFCGCEEQRSLEFNLIVIVSLSNPVSLRQRKNGVKRLLKIEHESRRVEESVCCPW